MPAKFCNQLKRLRKKAGMKQSEVAKILGVDGGRISEWEREIRTPKPLTQEAILVRLEKVRPKEKG